MYGIRVLWVGCSLKQKVDDETEKRKCGSLFLFREKERERD